MDIVVDESGVMDIVVYMLYHRVVDIIPHRLCQPHGIVDVVVHESGVMDIGSEPSGIVDGVIDKQGVILRTVDIAGVVDIVGNKRGVMHILVHVCNQRVVDVVVDIGGVMNIMIDKRGVMHLTRDIGSVVDIDRVVRQFAHPEGGDKALTGGGNESQRVLLRAVAPSDKARPEIRDGGQRHCVSRSVLPATRHPAKGIVISRNRDRGTPLNEMGEIVPILRILITR